MLYISTQSERAAMSQEFASLNAAILLYFDIITLLAYRIERNKFVLFISNSNGIIYYRKWMYNGITM